MIKKISFKKIKERIALVLFSYIIVMSVVEYVNTRDIAYIILPGILLIVILIEIASRYYGADQRDSSK